jgi:hypothetical protein
LGERLFQQAVGGVGELGERLFRQAVGGAGEMVFASDKTLR